MNPMLSHDELTVHEFEALLQSPEFADRRFELEAGRLIEMPPPGYRHGILVAWISHLLWQFAIQRGRGRVASGDAGLIVARDPDTVRGIDILFVDEIAPFEQISEKYLQHPPTLAVEVISPSDRFGALARRVDQYLEAGIPLIWVVDPEARNITAYRTGGKVEVFEAESEITGNTVLPDFRCRVADFFRLPGQS